jgi:hypothetical protein
MTVFNLSSNVIGWWAIGVGIAGVLGLVFIILFFSKGQPFGTLNDICNGLAAILSAVLAWLLYAQGNAESWLLSLIALILATAGALVVTIGSVLVISGKTGWFKAGLYIAAGNALIGLWLFGLNYSALNSNSWGLGLAVFGLIVGLIMALGLVAIPGIFSGIDSQESASCLFSYVGQAGGLGWLFLYPIWCIFLGIILLLR